MPLYESRLSTPHSSTIWSPTWRPCEGRNDDRNAHKETKGSGGHNVAVLAAALAASSVLGAQPDGQWLMYSGSYGSHGFFPARADLD